MEPLVLPSPRPLQGIRAHAAAPVIIAVDAGEQSDAALVAGQLLAGEGTAFQVVSVLPPFPVAMTEVQLPPPPDDVAKRRVEQRAMVLDQVSRVLGPDAKPRVEVPAGDPASTIARVARGSNAPLIVAGLGRHKVLDRMFGDETLLRLIRFSSTPVLGVTRDFAGAPHRIVVAADFSETSLRAARLAMELAAENATVYLCHVAPRDAAFDRWFGDAAKYKDDAGEALVKMRGQLRIPKGIAVQRVMLQGDPATELLAFASSVNADLIATGSHGHGFVARMLIGSVATKIIRASTCSVLTVPRHAAMTDVRTSVEPPARVSLPRPEWSKRLDEFSRRNIARRGVLEVDDPEIGAQAQEHDYPLLGTTYDHHDERVEIMLGELGDVNRHLTRSIGGVTAIDVLTDERGRDIALRVAHGAGQTLLMFIR
jgi:nucleotide-binding universal stress UspA family protein